MRSWYEAIRDQIVGTSGNRATDFNEGSSLNGIVEATATCLEEVSFASDRAYQDLYVATARGEALTIRAQELGRDRKPAAAAAVVIRFGGTAETVIPEGTRVADANPQVSADARVFATTAAAEIPVGEESVDVAAVAAEVGPEWNVPAGVVTTLVDTVVGISTCSNPSAAAGGTDEETDDDLRRRCALSPYRTAIGQPTRYWESLATDIVGVAKARCQGGGPGAFSVYLWSRDADGVLVPSSAELCTTVQTLLDTYVLPGVEVTVDPAPGVTQDIVGYLRVAEGATWENVAALATVAIEDLFPTTELVRAAVVAAAMGVTDAADFRLGVPAANVEAAEDGQVFCGIVKVLPMEWDGEYVL